MRETKAKASVQERCEQAITEIVGIMERDEEWGGDTLDAICDTLDNLGFAGRKDGYFAGRYPCDQYNRVAELTLPAIVVIDEDGNGKKHELVSFLDANRDSEEVWDAVRQLVVRYADNLRTVEDGITLGGGAAPLFTLCWDIDPRTGVRPDGGA